MVTSIKSIKRKSLIKEVIIGGLISIILIVGVLATKASPYQKDYEAYCKRADQLQQAALSYDEWKTMIKISK